MAVRRLTSIVVVVAVAVLAWAAVVRSAAERKPALGTLPLCQAYSGLPAGFGHDLHAGMVWVPGGVLTPGSQRGYPEERGGVAQPIAGFWLDRTEVTRAQFARFVAATGYVTEAERAGHAPVFRRPDAQASRERAYAWWQRVDGADWSHPEGPESRALDHPQHPVSQVTHADALAYARWLGRVLPSELQWEYAAKAQRDSLELHREPRDAQGKPTANFWQGDFPLHNDVQDGFATSAPVGCFAPNPWGLFDMLGNVWEWTGTLYTSSHRLEDHDESPVAGADSCTAPAKEGARLTLKGGSFLCSSNYCARYRVAARHAQEADQPAMHIGFRTLLAGP